MLGRRSLLLCLLLGVLLLGHVACQDDLAGGELAAGDASQKPEPAADAVPTGGAAVDGDPEDAAPAGLEQVVTQTEGTVIASPPASQEETAPASTPDAAAPKVGEAAGTPADEQAPASASTGEDAAPASTPSGKDAPAASEVASNATAGPAAVDTAVNTTSSEEAQPAAAEAPSTNATTASEGDSVASLAAETPSNSTALEAPTNATMPGAATNATATQSPAAAVAPETPSNATAPATAPAEDTTEQAGEEATPSPAGEQAPAPPADGDKAPASPTPSESSGEGFDYDGDYDDNEGRAEPSPASALEDEDEDWEALSAAPAGDVQAMAAPATQSGGQQQATPVTSSPSGTGRSRDYNPDDGSAGLFGLSLTALVVMCLAGVAVGGAAAWYYRSRGAAGGSAAGKGVEMGSVAELGGAGRSKYVPLVREENISRSGERWQEVSLGGSGSAGRESKPLRSTGSSSSGAFGKKGREASWDSNW